MRDSRVTVWAGTQTISSDTTTYGSTISLLADYSGNDHIYGTSDYGLPIEMIVTGVVTGTGDGFTLSFSFQVSDDGATWDEDVEFGVVTVNTDGYFLNDDNAIAAGLLRAKVNGRLKTARAYGRVKVVSAGITGGETADIKGSLADGVNPRNDRKFR